MMELKQKITRKGTGFSASEWRINEQMAMQEAGNTWHGEILDKHFSSKFEHEYHDQPRSKKYQMHKAATKHHRDPLVWSGRAKQAAKAIRDIRASSGQAKVTLHLPKYFYAYHKQGKDRLGRYYSRQQIDKNRELQTISPPDIKRLAEAINDKLQEVIDTAPQIERPLGT